MSKEIPAKIHRNTFAVFALGIYQQGLFLVVQWGALPRQLFYLGFPQFTGNASTENGAESGGCQEGQKLRKSIPKEETIEDRNTGEPDSLNVASLSPCAE
jgi:hypothetical protein